MELKLKEGVDLSSIILQNQIILTTIELLGEGEIHTDSEIALELMIAVVDKIAEQDVISYLSSLQGEKLLQALANDIEPFFISNVLTDNDAYINSMKNDILKYFNIIYEQQNSIGGIINYVISFITNMDEKDLDTVKTLIGNFDNGNKQTNIEKSVIKEKEKVNTKLENLISQYQKQSNA